MTVLVNEWQLNGQLNRALQQHQRADFGLWLAFLSPAVEESAEFTVADSVTPKHTVDLRQQFGVSTRVDPSSNLDDVALMRQQQEALFEGGLASWRLASLLQPPPQVIRHDAKKLDAAVLDNLSIHTKRRLQGEGCPEVIPDATQLYEVLAQLA